jgi:hypothetical protein
VYILYRYKPEVLALIVCRREVKTTLPPKVRQGHQASPKMFTKVIGLFKIVRQRYRTFLKKLTKVIELFKNCPATLPDFSKKAHQSHRTF